MSVATDCSEWMFSFCAQFRYFTFLC